MDTSRNLIFLSAVLQVATGMYDSYLQASGGFADGPIKIMWAMPLLLVDRRLFWFGAGWQKLNFFWLFLVICGGVFGLFFYIYDDGFLKYLFGDGLKFISAWTFLFYLCGLLSRDFGAFKKIVYLVVFLSVVDAIFTVYLSTIRTFKIHSTTYFAGLLIIIFLGRYYFSVLSRYSLLVFFVFAALSNGKRASIVFVAIFFAVKIIFHHAEHINLKKSFFMALGVVVGVVFVMEYGVHIFHYLYVATDLVTFKNFYDLLVAMDLGEGDISMESRFFEMYNTIIFFKENYLFVFFGKGFGGLFEMVYDTSVYSPDGRMHHAHINWVVYMMRHGLFGVIYIYSFMIGWLLFSFFVLLRASRNAFTSDWAVDVIIFSIASCIFTIFASMKSQILYDSAPPVIVLGFASIVFVSRYLISNDLHQIAVGTRAIASKF